MDDDSKSMFDGAADNVVALGNRLLEADQEADPWEIAEGLLAGAIHFWLYSRQPCDDPLCDNCADVSTADRRIRKLLDEARRHAEDSEYYETPYDVNVGRA